MMAMGRGRRGKEGSLLLLLLLFCWCCVVVVVAERPKLVGSSVWYTPNATILNTKYDSMLVQMDFDQPLYTNGHTFLCPDSEYGCSEEPPCKACDWSGQEPTGCDDSDCCGPAEFGNMELAKQWCGRENQPEYKTLKINEISERFTLDEGERMFVRFFVPEEYYCRSIQIIPRSYYGVPSSSFSTLDPFPTFSTETGWRNSFIEPSFGYGRSAIVICPNRTLHPEYSVGTFSGMYYGMVPTSFEVEILVSPETFPLPEPEVKSSCEDVPDEVMQYAATDTGNAFCLEDGQTLRTDPADLSSPFSAYVMPIPRGCHTISIASAGELPLALVSHQLLCLPSIVDPLNVSNVALWRTVRQGENVVFTACFDDDVSYVFCSVRHFDPTPVRFTFSTVAPVIRKHLTELPDASLSMQDGIQHAFGITFGRSKFTCYDFYTGCFEWITTPSDETLYFFPPTETPELDSVASIVYEDIQEVYREAGLQTKKENRLSLTVIFSSDTFQALSKDLDTLSIAITAITNKDGEVVDLPGGGVDQNSPDRLQYSISNYVSHIPLLDIPEFEYPDCDVDHYETYQRLAQERLEEVAQESSLYPVLSLKYSLDAMNQGVLSQSCTSQVADNLDTYETTVTFRDSIVCLEEFGTLQYWINPCCNVFISHRFCCVPFDYNATVTYYDEEADVSDCGEPECAQSYYQELAFSLNHFEDDFLGCTSGVKNPINTFALELGQKMKVEYIDCLVEVGFGEQYQGVQCQTDADCDHLLGECQTSGVCSLPPLETLEDQFLSCYIASMPSYVEFYLKRNILPSSVSNVDKNSTEFYLAVKEAATIQDCVNPMNPFDIFYRTQYRIHTADLAYLAVQYNLTWPEDAKEVLELCPGTPVLRSFPLSINVSSCELTGQRLLNPDVAYIESERSSCPLDEKCDIDLDGDCEGFHCVYCPPGEESCIKIAELTTEEECENAIACELPDGTVDYSLTEEECRNQGTGCTADCVGNSCESLYNLKGGCFLSSISSSSDCLNYGVVNSVVVEWYKDELCVLSEIDTESSCESYSSAEWETCQQNDVCSGETIQERYLGCYISLWHECANQEECEASGRCTDRDYYARIQSYDPVDIQYGVCLLTGEFVASDRPSCGSSNLFEAMITGCIAFNFNSPNECVPQPNFNGARWVDPSLTEEECLAIEVGRAGCRVTKNLEDFLLQIYDEDQCNCRGGEIVTAWDWIPGVWRGGVVRSLEWREARERAVFEYKDALSFILLADWLEVSEEEQFLFPLQSQIICESQSINLPVATLVCSCLANGGEECYDEGETQKEIPMGLSQVCEGEETRVKDPSAQVNFGVDSVEESCSFLNISLISRNWFSAPFAPPPLSFKWQDRRTYGVVLNENEATVGEVLGDGLVLTFSDPSVVEEFDVCLRLNQEPEEYKVPDFGYATSELDSIYPLGLKNVNSGDFPDGNWYCSEFNFKKSEARIEDTVYLFPINRLKNYEEETNEYTDDTTKGLCYTLGALYSVLGLLFFGSLIAFLRRTIHDRRQRVSLPNFCTSLFLILCIFRACFMFLYPTGTFEYEPLAYFVVFETPTFLLFSTVIFTIYIFKRLRREGFFGHKSIKILVVGWSFVWALWALVVIVYSEVILDNTSTSACEGRVAISNEDLEDQTRILAIAYQSVIIAITLALTIIFFYYTYVIFTTTHNKSETFTQFVVVVGGSFNVAFFLRTVLFIFMLAIDFSSSIYLFCTLFFTEILMMVFLFIQFHHHYLREISSVLSDNLKSRSSRSSASKSSYHSGSTIEKS